MISHFGRDHGLARPTTQIKKSRLPAEETRATGNPASLELPREFLRISKISRNDFFLNTAYSFLK